MMSLATDKVELTADETKLAKDKAKLTTDNAKLTVDETKRTADETRLAKDKEKLTADKVELVIGKRARIQGIMRDSQDLLLNARQSLCDRLETDGISRSLEVVREMSRSLDSQLKDYGKTADEQEARLLNAQLPGPSASLALVLRAVAAVGLSAEQYLCQRAVRLERLFGACQDPAKPAKQQFKEACKAVRECLVQCVEHYSIAFSHAEAGDCKLAIFVRDWLDRFVGVAMRAVAAAGDTVDLGALYAQCSLLDRQLLKHSASFLALLDGGFSDKAVSLSMAPLLASLASSVQVQATRVCEQRPSAPPIELLQDPVLAHLANAVVDALNSARYFPHPRALSLLEDELTSVAVPEASSALYQSALVPFIRESIASLGRPAPPGAGISNKRP